MHANPATPCRLKRTSSDRMPTPTCAASNEQNSMDWPCTTVLQRLTVHRPKRAHFDVSTNFQATPHFKRPPVDPSAVPGARAEQATRYDPDRPPLAAASYSPGRPVAQPPA